jgi:putative ABC transport system permease protein
MLRWTLKSLWQERVSVTAGAVGIALALLLGIYLDAVFRGEADQIAAFVERTDADVWVLQKGVKNLHMTRTQVTEDSIARIAATPGVARLTRLVYRVGLMGERGAERIVYVVGVPENVEATGLWTGTATAQVPAPGQAIVPAALARQSGLRRGDTIRIRDRRFTISGLSSGTFSMANPLVFIGEADARDLFDAGDGASTLLIKAAPGISSAALADALRAADDGIVALTQTELHDNDHRLALEMGGALIALMGAIGTGVAILIVAFTALAFVGHRVPELAVAKALGARWPALVGSALLQTALVALLGAGLALAAVAPMDAALSRFVPEVAVHFSWVTALQLGAVTTTVALLSALLPAWLVLRVDPALVFRG